MQAALSPRYIHVFRTIQKYCGVRRSAVRDFVRHSHAASLSGSEARRPQLHVSDTPILSGLPKFGFDPSDCFQPRFTPGGTAGCTFIISEANGLSGVRCANGLSPSYPSEAATPALTQLSQADTQWGPSSLLQYKPLRDYTGFGWPSRLGSRIGQLQCRCYSTASSVPDYYSILGVSKTVTQDEIKKAYRQTALKWHPDRNPKNREEAGKRFREASEAYQTLTDPRKRAQYDAALDGAAFRHASSHHEYSGPFEDMERGGQGGFRFRNLTPEEAELLFRRAFGGVSLDEVLRQALNQHGAARWRTGSPYQRHDMFEHRMGSRPSASFLDDREIYEILRNISGAGSEVGTQVSYHTRGGRIIERRTTVHHFPGGGMQTETTERDIGRDMGSEHSRTARSGPELRQPNTFYDKWTRVPTEDMPPKTGMGPVSPVQHLMLAAREHAKHAWRIFKVTALRAFARAVVRFITNLLLRRR